MALRWSAKFPRALIYKHAAPPEQRRVSQVGDYPKGHRFAEERAVNLMGKTAGILERILILDRLQLKG
jgi:hypothetical protein